MRKGGGGYDEGGRDRDLALALILVRALPLALALILVRAPALALALVLVRCRSSPR